MPTNSLEHGREKITVQGFWSGQPLTDLHWACLRSFLKLGHQFTLYSYEPLAVPQGIGLQDANAIVPAHEVFFFDNRETHTRDIAPFADYFRLRLLYQLGGWYCDVDTVCLSSQFPTARRVWARQCPELDPDSVSNGQLFFEKGDPFVLRLLERCDRLRRNIPRRESLGPMLLSSLVKELHLPRDMSGTAATFYPIRWVEVFTLWLPEFREEVEERVAGATFLPIFQSFPLYIGLDPLKGPPEGSYLACLLAEFLPDLMGPRHDAEDVRRLTRRWLQSSGSWAIDWLTAIHGPGILARLAL
jgi:Glycosyltransferase sugar-binding region containing DXD motif